MSTTDAKNEAWAIENRQRSTIPGNHAEQPCSADVVAALYHELLYAVCSKFPGESRHQTALRYILEQENKPPEAAKMTSEE